MDGDVVVEMSIIWTAPPEAVEPRGISRGLSVEYVNGAFCCCTIAGSLKNLGGGRNLNMPGRAFVSSIRKRKHKNAKEPKKRTLNYETL